MHYITSPLKKINWSQQNTKIYSRRKTLFMRYTNKVYQTDTICPTVSSHSILNARCKSVEELGVVEWLNSLADPVKARGCFTNTTVIHSLIKSLFHPLPHIYIFFIYIFVTPFFFILQQGGISIYGFKPYFLSYKLSALTMGNFLQIQI